MRPGGDTGFSFFLPLPAFWLGWQLSLTALGNHRPARFVCACSFPPQCAGPAHKHANKKQVMQRLLGNAGSIVSLVVCPHKSETGDQNGFFSKATQSTNSLLTPSSRHFRGSGYSATTVGCLGCLCPWFSGPQADDDESVYFMTLDQKWAWSRQRSREISRHGIRTGEYGILSANTCSSDGLPPISLTGSPPRGKSNLGPTPQRMQAQVSISGQASDVADEAGLDFPSRDEVAENSEEASKITSPFSYTTYPTQAYGPDIENRNVVGEHFDITLARSDNGEVGICFRRMHGEWVITRLIDESPAARSSHMVRAGDVIRKVNGKPVAGETLRHVIDTIKGEARTSVILTLRRDQLADAQDNALTAVSGSSLSSVLPHECRRVHAKGRDGVGPSIGTCQPSTGAPGACSHGTSLLVRLTQASLNANSKNVSCLCPDRLCGCPQKTGNALLQINSGMLVPMSQKQFCTRSASCFCVDQSLSLALFP